MTVTTNAHARPFTEEYLVAYSAEHVAYEFDMFLWLAHVCGNSSVRLGAPTAADSTRLSNALIESFVVHLRNLIDFLYSDDPKPTDVVAGDYLDPNGWKSFRPPMSNTLEAARVRANKEIAHLTTRRLAGRTPGKAWDFRGLAAEIRPVMESFAETAPMTRLSSNVLHAIRLSSVS